MKLSTNYTHGAIYRDFSSYLLKTSKHLLSNWYKEKVMGRKNRKDQVKDNRAQKIWTELYEYLEDSVDLIAALTEDEIDHLNKYIAAYAKLMKNGVPQSTHVIDYYTMRDFFAINNLPRVQTMKMTGHVLKIFDRFFEEETKERNEGNENRFSYLVYLSIAAMKKGFESVIAYIRFAELTVLEEDGVYQIVSEEDQRNIKRWVHVKQNLQNKWNINIIKAISESNQVWEVPET